MKKLILLAAVAGLLMLAGCSKDIRVSESVLDNPEMHISMGMRLFNDGKYEEARGRFEDAIRIRWNKEDKAGAYAGLGMYYAVRGNRREAEKNAKEAVKLNSKLPLAHTSYGRTVMYLNRNEDGDRWIRNAERHFERAIKAADDLRDNRAKAEAYYFKGLAAKTAYNFGMAKDAFTEVIKLKDAYAEEANREWEIVQMIERARPGTKIGAKVALMDKVGKAEIAVLFVEEMKIENVLDRRERKEFNTDFVSPTDAGRNVDQTVKPSDTNAHWAENWIDVVLKRGVMENAPDGRFYPDKEITRAEYALILLRVMVLITMDESLYTRHFGEENSIFNDVRTDHYAYNAMAVAASRGFMRANMNGEFELNKTVSGAEALLIIRDFQNALRLTF